MNRRYYGCRLQAAKHWNLFFEIVTALASSATIAAWTFWRTGPGVYSWQVLAALSAVCAVIKPFLGLSKEIERYSELVAGYSVLFYEMKQLLEDVRAADGISDDLWARYQAGRSRMKELGVKDDARPKRRLHTRCYEETKRQITTAELWWPEEATK